MWDLHNLFNDSGHNHDFFDDFLNLNNLGNLNHLFDDLVNVDSDFLDSFDGSWNLNDFLNDNLDGIVLSNVMIDWLLNFDDLVDLHNSVDQLLHFDDLRNLDSLNDNLSDSFWHSHDSLMDDWHLDSSVDNLLHLLDQSGCVVHNLLYFLNSVLINDLLSDDFNGLDSWDFDLHLDYFLDSLWNLNDFLDDLNDRNWLLDSDLNNFWDVFNVVDNFSGVSVLN